MKYLALTLLFLSPLTIARTVDLFHQDARAMYFWADQCLIDVKKDARNIHETNACEEFDKFFTYTRTHYYNIEAYYNEDPTETILARATTIAAESSIDKIVEIVQEYKKEK